MLCFIFIKSGSPKLYFSRQSYTNSCNSVRFVNFLYVILVIKKMCQTKLARCRRPQNLMQIRRDRTKVNFCFLNGKIRSFTYHLVERFRTRTMIYGLRWFKVSKGQLQGEATYFIRAIEYFILCNGDLLMRKYAATLNVQSGDLKHRCMHRERDITACRTSFELMAEQARVTRSFIYSMVVDISLYTCCFNFPPK